MFLKLKVWALSGERPRSAMLFQGKHALSSGGVTVLLPCCVEDKCAEVLVKGKSSPFFPKPFLREQNSVWKEFSSKSQYELINALKM